MFWKPNSCTSSGESLGNFFLAMNDSFVHFWILFFSTPIHCQNVSKLARKFIFSSELTFLDIYQPCRRHMYHTVMVRYLSNWLINKLLINEYFVLCIFCYFSKQAEISKNRQYLFPDNFDFFLFSFWWQSDFISLTHIRSNSSVSRLVN